MDKIHAQESYLMWGRLFLKVKQKAQKVPVYLY